MPRPKPTTPFIPGFTPIAPSIYEHTPSPRLQDLHLRKSKSKSKSTPIPSLILLCTWTGAQARYIAKYTSEYRTLFPSARIMVIATTAKDLCFRNSARKQTRLLPAVERISSLEYLNTSGSGNSEGILLHVFSEGGSNKACELAEAYYATTGQRLPVSAMCFDSTPGHPRYLRLCNALNKSLPQIPVLRHTGLVLGSAVLGAIWVTYHVVKGYENNVITRTRRRLLDAETFDLSVPRCYLYGPRDELIAWRDVHEHAEESAREGMCVTEVLFEGSGHVEHAKSEPERYWGAVVETWRSARPGEKKCCGKKGRSGRSSEEKKCYVIVEEEDSDSGDEKKWSDSDSQRTLLPHPGRRVMEFDV